MRKILLTRGLMTLVDDEDFGRLNKHKWCAHKGCNTFYAMRQSAYINGKRHTILMHHEIIGKSPKGFEVDHKDGDGINNQKYNLRYVTRRQNTQNGKRRKKSSIFPGVSWNKRNKKWEVHIRINKTRKFLGYFANELNAFNIYKQAVEKLGETVI